MAISSCGVRTNNGASGSPSWEVRPPSAANPRLLELSIITATASGSFSLGFGRAAAIGIGPTASSPFQFEDIADGPLGTNPNSTVTAATAWGTNPTQPATFIRRYNFQSTVGLGVIWTFPRGLLIPANTSAVVWNLVTGQTAADVSCVLDE